MPLALHSLISRKTCRRNGPEGYPLKTDVEYNKNLGKRVDL